MQWVHDAQLPVGCDDEGSITACVRILHHNSKHDVGQVFGN